MASTAAAKPSSSTAAGEKLATVKTTATKWWDLILRPIIDALLLPCWHCTPTTLLLHLPFLSRDNRTVTGTILCPQSDRVKLCLQESPLSPPFLLIDLPISTADFAAEIAAASPCRIALECTRQRQPGCRGDDGAPLLTVPRWAVYLNGRRRPGFASRQQVTEWDAAVLEAMGTVSVGAGSLPRRSLSMLSSSPQSTPSPSREAGGWCKYLRGNFERVVGSANSESYHLVEAPGGCLDQDLSIFFLRL